MQTQTDDVVAGERTAEQVVTCELCRYRAQCMLPGFNVNNCPITMVVPSALPVAVLLGGMGLTTLGGIYLILHFALRVL